MRRRIRRLIRPMLDGKVGRMTLYDWLAGRSRISDDKLAAVLAALDIRKL